YSPEAVARLARELRLSPAATVLDLGAGTGKLTRALAATGAAVVAVEPVEGMRRTFRRVLPAVPLIGATAEALPVAGGSVDTAVAGQAFHWFRADAALASIHRVLRPGGRLGLVWNVRDESVEWVAALTRLIDAHVGPGPGYRYGAWRESFSSTRLFGPLGTAGYRTEQRVTTEGVVDRVATISHIAALPDAERERIAEQVRGLLARHPDTRNRDTHVILHRTDVFWCDRLD
ncbi:MAG TPA: class I SAM-dependent methyltransferase, partial [Acidimicrobiia bacterium]|nr:class I SAM-dependent methyltransferase [Acidimicrobiia bacterium]